MRKVKSALDAILAMAIIVGMVVLFMLTVADQPPQFANRDYSTLTIFDHHQPPGAEAASISGHTSSYAVGLPVGPAGPRHGVVYKKQWDQ